MAWLFGAEDDGIAALGLSEEPPMVAPAGSYQVRVRVVEARDLSAILNFSLYKSLLSLSWKTQVEAEDKLPNCQAVVRLNRDGFKPQKRKTIVEKETSSPLWNQLFYFEDVEVAEGELDACSIQITVQDRTSIGRSLTIGTCDLNLASVYQMDGHEVWKEWMTLTDAKGKREGSQGQVCVCVTVLRSTDSPVQHGDADSEDEALVGPPPSHANVDPEVWVLKASVYAGRDLPRMDYFGKAGIDAYLRLQCGSSKAAKTRNKRSRTPEWNQELILKLVVPPGKGGIANMPPLKMSLMDADYDKDDHIASQSIPLRDLLLKPDDHKHPKWYSFYGGPREMELAWFSRMSKLAKRMNAGYVEGSAYRGRALLALSLFKETRRTSGMRAKKKIPSVIDKLGQEWPVFLHCEIHSLELNQTRHVGRAASVELTMGLVKLASPGRTLRSEGGVIGKECYAHFNIRMNPMRVRLPTPFEGPLQGEGAPDLFVDVYVGRNRIGYCRVPTKNLMPVKECHSPIKPPDVTETWKLQGWFNLHADAIGDHKRGQSRRAEHVRPVGRVLLRMMLHGSPNAKRDAKMMSQAELKAQEEAEAAEDSDDDPEAATEANADKLAEALRRKAETRAMRAAAIEPPEKIKPLPSQNFMLQVQLYQAKDLPAADAQGSSDPFAVIRCGRNQAKTSVKKSTTAPAWFQEIFMQVELPLQPLPSTRRKSGAVNPEGSESSGDETDSEGSGSDFDVEKGEMTLDQASARGIKPGRRRGAGSVQGFEGVAWWAAPALSIVLMDKDEGLLGGDVDPLSVATLPLIHPDRRRPVGGGNPGEAEDEPFSTLASSASLWTNMSVDDLPDQYVDLRKYRVGIVQPQWHDLVQLKPTREGGTDLRCGGKILLHYTLKPIPPEGIYAHAGVETPKKMLRNTNPKVVRSLGDFFGSYPVEVQVLLLGLRGLEPYRGIAVASPRVEIELSGALPLFPGSPFTVQTSQHSSNPSGANANFNGQVLRLRGRVHRLDQIELALSIRIIDALPVKRIVGTGEHKLKLFEEEDEDDVGPDGQKRRRPKLKPLKPKPLTAEERRELETQGMDSTESERSFSDDSETSTDDVRDSDTMSLASAEYRAMEHAGKRSESFLSKASSRISASFRSASHRMSKTLSKVSSKQYRRERERMRVMEGTLPFDASEAGSIRKAGSFKGSFKRVVSVEKAGSIVSRDTLGRTHSVKVYREKGTDDRDFDSDDSYGRRAKRAASVTKHTQLATVDEASEGDADGGAGDGGGDDGSVSFEGGEGIGGGRIGGVIGGTRAPSVAGTAMSEDRTVLTGAPTEEFTTDESESGSDSGSESGSDATSGSGSGSGSDAERGDGSSFSEDEEDSEAGLDDDEPRFDDGSGTTPEWMVGRSMVTSGNLEDYMRPLPFITVPIYRAKGFKDSTSDRVEGGKLKFAIRVLPLMETDVEPELLEKEEEKPLIQTKRGKEKRELKEAMVKDSAFVADEEGATMPRKQFLALQRLIGGGPSALLPQEITVRAFVVRGKDLRPLDPSGLCDPYLRVELQGTRKRFGSRNDHVKETLAPWFYKMFQFNTELPGCSQLQFKLLDWDKGGGDDLIGSSVVDLEDRWFSAAWNGEFAKMPPLELRQLRHPDATGNQGNLEVWVEMYEAGDEVPKPMPIFAPPVIDVEMRVVVFKARNIVNKDIGGQNDLFFKVGLVGVDHKQTRFGSTQSTDTHYFATDGKGSFNYRLVYRFTIPVTKAKLRISAFDRDVIGSNDNIGEAVVPLTGLCKDLMRAIELSPEGELGENAVAEISKKDQPAEKGFGSRFESFMDGATEGLWVPMYHPSKNEQLQGEVEIMVTLLPVRRAEQKPVGKGREQPNRDPVLQPPVRVTLNPFDPIGSLAIIMGPDMLRKVLIVGFCLLCLFLGASLAVFIVNDVLSAYINIAIAQATGQAGGGGSMPLPSHFP